MWWLIFDRLWWSAQSHTSYYQTRLPRLHFLVKKNANSPSLDCTMMCHHELLRTEGKSMLSLHILELGLISLRTGHHEAFKWSEVRRGVLNISTWLSASAYFGILAGLYSFGLF